MSISGAAPLSISAGTIGRRARVRSVSVAYSFRTTKSELRKCRTIHFAKATTGTVLRAVCEPASDVELTPPVMSASAPPQTSMNPSAAPTAAGMKVYVGAGGWRVHVAQTGSAMGGGPHEAAERSRACSSDTFVGGQYAARLLLHERLTPSGTEASQCRLRPRRVCGEICQAAAKSRCELTELLAAPDRWNGWGRQRPSF
eukprot:7378194-Prymnesium_polylepis.1